MIDITVDKIIENHQNLNNVGILATTGAVSSRLWQNSLIEHGLNSVLMDKEIHKSEFMEAIYGKKGIKNNYLTEKNKKKILKCVRNLKNKGAESIIAGCTELPLILNQSDMDIPLFVATEATIERIIDMFYGN